MKIFSGRVAFVTGGASGIGFGLVQNFLKVGMKVVIVDFNRGYIEEVRGMLAHATTCFSSRRMSVIVINCGRRPTR